VHELHRLGFPTLINGLVCKVLSPRYHAEVDIAGALVDAIDIGRTFRSRSDAGTR